MSARPHAKITVDYSDAVKMEGVRAYVGAQDVPGSNACHGNLDLIMYCVSSLSLRGRREMIVVAGH